MINGATLFLIYVIHFFCSLVKSLIDANKVMLFSKSYCPFCMMAKDVLKEAGVKNMKVLEIEERDDVMQIQVRYI